MCCWHWILNMDIFTKIHLVDEIFHFECCNTRIILHQISSPPHFPSFIDNEDLLVFQTMACVFLDKFCYWSTSENCVMTHCGILSVQVYLYIIAFSSFPKNSSRIFCQIARFPISPPSTSDLCYCSLLSQQSTLLQASSFKPKSTASGCRILDICVSLWEMPRRTLIYTKKPSVTAQYILYV